MTSVIYTSSFIHLINPYHARFKHMYNYFSIHNDKPKINLFSLATVWMPGKEYRQSLLTSIAFGSIAEVCQLHELLCVDYFFSFIFRQSLQLHYL